MNFRFVIPATHDPKRQTLALHLLVSFVLFGAGVFCLAMYWFTGISPKFPGAIKAFGIFGAVCSLGGIAVYILSVSAVRRKRFTGFLRVLELVLIVGGSALFFSVGKPIPATLFALLGVLAGSAAIFERKAPADTVIEVDEEGVRRKAGLKNTFFPWRAVKQVLYRRGILTIDLLDNKLIQYAVRSAETDGEILEAFCAAQVEKAIPQRAKNDW